MWRSPDSGTSPSVAVAFSVSRSKHERKSTPVGSTTEHRAGISH